MTHLNEGEHLHVVRDDVFGELRDVKSSFALQKFKFLYHGHTGHNENHCRHDYSVHLMLDHIYFYYEWQ